MGDGEATLAVTEEIAPDDEAAIRTRLLDYNNTTLLGPTDRRNLAILLRDTDGNVDGGLVGYTGRGWLYVQMLFVPERLRGRGIAGQLLKSAEDEAIARGCRGAYIDTINPVACRTYERAGYQVFGRIENFSNGLDICWLIKRFAETADPQA